MASLTVPRNTIRYGDHTLVELPDLPLAAGAVTYDKCMVGITSAGYVVDGGDSNCVKVIGIADGGVDNSAGSAGAKKQIYRRGAFKFDNSTGNPIVQASIYLTTMKAEDNHTICVAGGTGKAISGRVLRLDSDGVVVEFY